ncbi:MAG: hypothetical protein ACI4BC_00630 [Muribaculaceae bacterium]
MNKVILFLATMAVSAISASPGNLVSISCKNGDVNSWQISQVRSFTFPEGSWLRVNTFSGSDATLPISDVCKITFTTDDSGVEAVIPTTLRLSIVGDFLSIEGVNEVSQVNVYSLDGSLVAQGVSSEPLNIGALSSGVYVIKTDCATAKFLKR